MEIKSVLKPEGSIMAGIAVAGSVFAVYDMGVGSISNAHASDANHPALESSRKKAGYTSFLLVSALALITKDGNVAVLGYSSIVAAEIAYRHGIMVSPATGAIQSPDPSAFTPATDNVISMPQTTDEASGY